MARILVIALAALALKSGAAFGADVDIRSVAEFLGSVKVTVAKCSGLAERDGVTAAYLATHDIPRGVLQSDAYQDALHSYIDRKQNSRWECIRSYVDFGPDGEKERLFDLAPGEKGESFAQEASMREARAARNYRLITNARNLCGFLIDDRSLIYHLLEDGIYDPFLHDIRNGETPSGAEERNPHFIRQLAAWRDADREIRSYPSMRSYCHTMWTLYGSSGSEYLNVLRLPDQPYSPFEEE